MDKSALMDLARQQDNVVTRTQLREVGYDRWAVRHRVRTDRWQIRGTRVVVLHSGPLTVRQAWWAGLLHAGPGAYLAGRTAATLHGVRGIEDGLCHVVVAPGRKTPALPGVRVHESKHPADATNGSPRRQPLGPALVSAAAWTGRREVAAGILATAVQQRRVTPAELRLALCTAGRVRHAGILR
jgi:hypothetical protein